MASVKVKKRLMYTVFACVFLFGGIEYAVILPTLWLYLDNEYHAPEYMLGMVLSAYSVAAFFSAPVIGRLADRTRRTKPLFIMCATFEMIGSFLYFIDASQWLCLGSRLISGLGAGGEAVAYAEVARYTSEVERTGIMSKLSAIRQIALLMGPGLNLFLRMSDFAIGPFKVNKYTSPAGFMVIMWIILILVVLTLYPEPALLYAQEAEESAATLTDAEVSTTVTSTDSVRSSDTQAFNKSSRVTSDAPHSTETRPPAHTNTNNSPHSEHMQKSTSEVNYDSSYDANTHLTETYDSETTFQKHSVEKNTLCPEKFYLDASVDLMATAERFIYSSQWDAVTQRGHHDDSEKGVENGLVFDEHHFDERDDDLNTHQHYNVVFAGGDRHVGERTRLLDDNTVSSHNNPNQPYIERSVQDLDDPIAREGKLGFFCNEYIRDEIVAVLFLLFCCMFSQMCVETMVTPLSLKYMDFGEFENSLMYCFCGVEVIAVFGAVVVLSKRVQDRKLLLFGLVTILASNIWLIYYLPMATPHDRSKNLPMFAIAVALDLISLPFLFVCSTSLFSKLTRKQTQGLSQGLRRGIVGLGTVLAPLWGSATVNEPYLLIGVLLGLQALSMLLLLVSFKRMKVSVASTPSSAAQPSLSQRGNFGSLEAQTPHRSTPVTNHTSHYGSIQNHSLETESYSSLVDSALREDMKYFQSPPIVS